MLDMETLKKLTPEQQDQVLAGVRQQAALANAQNLVTVRRRIGWENDRKGRELMDYREIRGKFKFRV